MEQPISFGDWVRRRRRALDLTQDALAQQAGCALATIKKIEIDERRPSRAMAERLAACLRIPPDQCAAFLHAARHTADVDGLADPAVPLRASSSPPARLLHNLPALPNSLIGREAELAAIYAHLRRVNLRLLTLLGPGGSGKTRLALEAAREQLGQFPDGVWLVDLTPIRDSALVLPTIARTLGLRESGGRLIADQLSSYLHDRALLLLLDNLEQVIDAAPDLAALLGAAPRLHILATSRAALRLAGEQIYPVPPLAAPIAGAPDPLSSPAAQLFLARARAARADFIVDSADVGAIAAICRRLEGLPLAIELAAARVRLLSPLTILERLIHPLDLLTVGARDLPTRQQTLRAAIGWSYDLLTAPEQALFRWLGVFIGGWDLAALASIGGSGAETLDLLGALIDKSLVQQPTALEGAVRYTMLETIREYAVEQLEACGEAERARDAHAAYFLALAQEAERELVGQQATAWLVRLETEHDNLRMMLDYLLAQQEYMQLAGACHALFQFWFEHGAWSEGCRWLETSLETHAATAIAPGLRGRVLLDLGRLLGMQSDFVRALACCEESLILLRQEPDQPCVSDVLEGIRVAKWGLSDYAGSIAAITEAVAIDRARGDRYRLAWHLTVLAFDTFISGDVALARALNLESLALFQDLGMRARAAMVLIDLAACEKAEERYERADALLEEALALAQETGDRFSAASALGWMSQVQLAQGQYARAEALAAEDLAIRHELGDRRGVVAVYAFLADAVLGSGDIARARDLVAEGLRLARELTYQQGYSWLLRSAVAQALAARHYERAAQLLGAEEALRTKHAISIWPDERAQYMQMTADTRAALSMEAFSAAWAIGRAQLLDAAVALALTEA